MRTISVRLVPDTSTVLAMRQSAPSPDTDAMAVVTSVMRHRAPVSASTESRWDVFVWDAAAWQ